MTPILLRSWLRNITVVRDFDKDPVILRRALDIRRACSPIWVSPMSPSSSARGTRAATESTTTMSTAEERTSWSTTSSAISPESGWSDKTPEAK